MNKDGTDNSERADSGMDEDSQHSSELNKLPGNALKNEHWPFCLRMLNRFTWEFISLNPFTTDRFSLIQNNDWKSPLKLLRVKLNEPSFWQDATLIINRYINLLIIIWTSSFKNSNFSRPIAWGFCPGGGGKHFVEFWLYTIFDWWQFWKFP